MGKPREFMERDFMRRHPVRRFCSHCTAKTLKNRNHFSVTRYQILDHGSGVARSGSMPSGSIARIGMEITGLLLATELLQVVGDLVGTHLSISF